MNDRYLIHHGILGQKWGVRRYQNYDGTLIKTGSNYRKKTKYTNIDGSLNEEGKLHSQSYINKQMSKNNKYYNKYINKYQKLADKNKDDAELSKKFLDMIKDAERSRDSVNENIKKMGIDEIMSNEKETRDKALKIAGAIGGTAAAVAAGAALPALATYGAAKASEYISRIDPAKEMAKLEAWTMTPQGKQAEKYVEQGIRTYSDVNAYVFSIYADQTIRRLQESGAIDQAGAVAGQFMNKAASSAGANAGSLMNLALTNAGSAASTGLGQANNAKNSAVSSINQIIADNPELIKQLTRL